MANPRALVNALYTHWDTVEVLVRLSRKHVFLLKSSCWDRLREYAPGSMWTSGLKWCATC